MSQSTATSRPRRRWLRRSALAAVVLVPLAFAGLFVGALANSGSALDRIPAAIVNQDTLVYTTAADGTKTPVFAGRQLVTELTGGSAGFDWTITNEKAAKKALADGSVYAILTVPKNFSTSILSLGTNSPQQAKLAIKTDDAHSYLTGALAQTVGDTMANTFGKAVTAQYISGLYSSMGEVGVAFSSAAGGASQLASGVGSYTAGVDSLASGLGTLSSGASKLTQLSGGVASYTDGVSQLARALAQANAGLQADPSNPVALATVNALSAKLSEAAAGGTALSQQTAAAVSGIQGGISKSASGAARLAAGSAGLDEGAKSLASGLQSGAGQIPKADAHAAASSAKVASNPVAVAVSHNNRIPDIGQVIATFFVPLGLWIGALAVFLVLRPVTRRALSSTAANGRLVFASLAKAGAITVAQALLLVGLLHLALGVSWSSLPVTLGFSVLMALAFTAFHHLLTIGLGKAGLVVSLFVLAVQVTSTGGLYPIQVLATPFQWVSPLLPLTYGVRGMQGIIAGGDVGAVIAASVILLGFGVASVLVALGAMRHTRRVQSLLVRPAIV